MIDEHLDLTGGENEIAPGVREFAIALRRVQLEFDLESVMGSRRLPDGHLMSLRWMSLQYTGDVIEIERDDGWCHLVTEPPEDVLSPESPGPGEPA